MTTTTRTTSTRPARRTFASYVESVRDFSRVRALPMPSSQQGILVFIVVVGVLAVMTGLYLDVTARASIAGRQIQTLEQQILATERANADLETKMALLLSNQTMERRARDLGYESVKMDEVEYVVVPGYYPTEAVRFASSPQEVDILSLSPEFRQSMIEWFAEQLKAASEPLASAK
jgi:cell division protein FtsB